MKKRLQTLSTRAREILTPENTALLYLVTLCGFIGYYGLHWPVFAGDTDVWYHLSGGRRYFETGRIPDDSFFSFIAPPRQFINYYWLFQVLVYRIFEAAGYYGLIFFRALVFVGTITLTLGLLLRGLRTFRAVAYFLAVSVVYVIALTPRFLLVRPHLVSFFCLAAFLFILKYGRRSLWLLPAIALVWVNCHGIEYPVMVFICFASLVDWAWKRHRTGEMGTGKNLWPVIPVVLSMWMVLLTPGGGDLLALPFESLGTSSMYINEMRLPALSDFVTTTFWGLIPEGYTGFSVIFVLGFVSLCRGLRRRTVRPSHVLLYVGGLILLSKGIRFSWEAAFMAVPVLRSGAIVSDAERRKVPGLPVVLLTMVLAVTSFFFIREIPQRQYRYPMSYRKIPVGVAAFLNRYAPGGTILNNSNTGGYVHWKLFPRYRIYMDLQMLLFTDGDQFYGRNALADPWVLSDFLDRYEPDYITVPVEMKGFSTRIKGHPEYLQVFFDDQEVLYANRNVLPRLVARNAMRGLDVFGLVGTDLRALPWEEKEMLRRELLRVDSKVPEIALVNQALCTLYLERGEYARALMYAAAVIRINPGETTGLLLKGDALLGKREWEKALAIFKDALKLSGEGEKNKIYQKIWLCNDRLKRYKTAYQALSRSINPFSLDTRFEQLYDYGLTALKAGKNDKALMAFRFAMKKVPKDRPEDIARIEEKLALFTGEGGGRAVSGRD